MCVVETQVQLPFRGGGHDGGGADSDASANGGAFAPGVQGAVARPQKGGSNQNPGRVPVVKGRRQGQEEGGVTASSACVVATSSMLLCRCCGRRIVQRYPPVTRVERQLVLRSAVAKTTKRWGFSTRASQKLDLV